MVNASLHIYVLSLAACPARCNVLVIFLLILLLLNK